MLYEHSALFLVVDSILEQKNFNQISQGETVKKHLSKATKDLLDTLHLSFSTMKKNVYNPIVHHGGLLLLLELLWHFDPG